MTYKTLHKKLKIEQQLGCPGMDSSTSVTHRVILVEYGYEKLEDTKCVIRFCKLKEDLHTISLISFI
jgi:hypothetical protein